MNVTRQLALGRVVDHIRLLRAELESYLTEETRILCDIPQGMELEPVWLRQRRICENLDDSLRSLDAAMAHIMESADG